MTVFIVFWTIKERDLHNYQKQETQASKVTVAFNVDGLHNSVRRIYSDSN